MIKSVNRVVLFIVEEETLVYGVGEGWLIGYGGGGIMLTVHTREVSCNIQQ